MSTSFSSTMLCLQMSLVKRRRARLCQEKLGVGLLVCLAAVILLGSYPGQDPDVRSLHEKSFDIQNSGVVVILHIANAGTDVLSNYLIKQAALDPLCHCRDPLTKCQCLNMQGNPWLFNAFNNTGYVCGVLAGFSVLTDCHIDYWFRTSGRDARPRRRYLMVTMIRDPIQRLISQWQSLTQENTFFKNEPRLFRNESVELQKAGLACYVGKKLSSLSLEDFLACSENGASNHQTRMLANLTFVNSLGLTGASYQEALFASAKRTLEMLPFFGIYSRPNDTQKLLESTVGFRFKQHFSLEDSFLQEIFPLPVSLHRHVMQVNTLDLRLFQFAKVLFQERVKAVRSSSASGSKSLSDNFRIIHRPDLNADSDIGQGGGAIDRPDLNQKGSSLPGSDVILDNYDVIKEDNSVMDRDYEEGGASDGDYTPDGDYTDVGRSNSPGRNSSPGLSSQITTSVADNYGSEDDEIKGDTRKLLPNFAETGKKVVSKSANIRPAAVSKSAESGLEADPMSPDYRPDVEDVFMFLNRLEQLKLNQKEQAPKSQQLLSEKNSLSYSPPSSSLRPPDSGHESERREGLPKVGPTLPARSYQSGHAGDVRPAARTAKTERKVKDKEVNRMFQ